MIHKKLLVAIVIAASTLILLSIDSIANALLGFALAGVVPGTTMVIPFWAMVALWCLVITVITTAYLETTLGFIRSHKHHHTRRARMPRRRYSSI